jgi:hypothetical protein
MSKNIAGLARPGVEPESRIPTGGIVTDRTGSVSQKPADTRTPSEKRLARIEFRLIQLANILEREEVAEKSFSYGNALYWRAKYQNDVPKSTAPAIREEIRKTQDSLATVADKAKEARLNKSESFFGLYDEQMKLTDRLAELQERHANAVKEDAANGTSYDSFVSRRRREREVDYRELQNVRKQLRTVVKSLVGECMESVPATIVRDGVAVPNPAVLALGRLQERLDSYVGKYGAKVPVYEKPKSASAASVNGKAKKDADADADPLAMPDYLDEDSEADGMESEADEHEA